MNLNKIFNGDQESMNKILGNLQVIADFAKAAETVSTNTYDPAVRSIFTPENLDPIVKLTVPTATPLRNRFGRAPGMGQATAWSRLVSKLHSRSGHAGVGTNTTIAFADAGAPGETTQQYTTVAAAYKLLGRKIELGGMYIAASRGNKNAPNAFDQRLRTKVIETMIGEEEMIISGDSAVNPLEFDGLAKQITTNSGTASLLTVSGINAQAVTPIFNEGGIPSLLVANPRQVRALADELQGAGSIQRIVVDNQGKGIGGVHLDKFTDSLTGQLIDVRVSRYVGPLAFLLTEKFESGENAIEMEDLIPMSRVDVPSGNYSQIAFTVEATVLKVIAEPWQYKWTGLAV
jgi:hypothetical protein